MRLKCLVVENTWLRGTEVFDDPLQKPQGLAANPWRRRMREAGRIVSVYPRAVKSLAGDIWCGHHSERSARYSRWVLDIAGPFCPSDRDGAPIRAVRLADAVSRFLALPTTHVRSGVEISVLVQITGADRERLIKREYERCIVH
jgi:hypothetical protein